VEKKVFAAQPTNMPPRGVATKDEFLKALNEATSAAKEVSGHLTDKDSYILTMLAVCPTAAGEVVEIGSYKGRSTILLSTALGFTGDPRMHACDPFAALGRPGQDLATDESVYAEFKTNLQVRNLTDRVSIHRCFSVELAEQWCRPIRLLWIDGDHSYAGATADFEAWHGFVSPGGCLVMHDVLHHPPGPSQVFVNRILLDDKWGACGLCGSVGWAQKVRSFEEAHAFRKLKVSLYRKVSRFTCCAALGARIQGWNKLRYKLLRARIPHRSPSFEAFADLIGYTLRGEA